MSVIKRIRELSSRDISEREARENMQELVRQFNEGSSQDPVSRLKLVQKMLDNGFLSTEDMGRLLDFPDLQEGDE